MTQEELDALMEGGADELDALDDGIIEEEMAELESSESEEDDDVPAGYNEETAHQWPLPATNENKMVHQLDDVTKESEEKASEIFDIIEGISNELMEKEENLSSVVEILTSNILAERFTIPVKILVS